MIWICSLSVIVLHETLIVPVLIYGSETMLWKEKEISRIRAVQCNNLRGLLGIKGGSTSQKKGIKRKLPPRVGIGLGWGSTSFIVRRHGKVKYMRGF